MKLRSALLLTALLGASSAFAATSPATSAAAPAAHEKGMSSKACNKQADERKLTGVARTSFVKDCRAGKSHDAK